MKRKSNGTQFLGSDYISATKTRNYALKDSLLDYLNLYKSKPVEVNQFSEFIMNQGINFEESIMLLLRNKFGNDIKQISSNPLEDSKSVSKYKETIKAIKDKVPIIYQGVLHNYKNKTYGVPDLIVRKDYIPKLVTEFLQETLTEEYYIIDIKFTTLYFSSKDFILNCGSVPAFKCQILVYLDALNLILKSKCDIAFILGRRWKKGSTGNSENSAFNRLGVINYSSFDFKYIKKTKKAIEWYNLVKNEGDLWSLNPPSNKWLYPNMKNNYDNPWRPFKIELAEKIKEITLIWQCGVKRRKLSHKTGNIKWTTTNASKLGFKRVSKYYNTVNKIITINKNKKVKNSLKIKNNLYNWKKELPLDFYVDYETISNITDDFLCLPQIDEKSSIIFLIGCGFIDPNTKEWIYKYFIADHIDPYSEHTIITNWFNYMNEIKNKFSLGIEPRLIHWGNAEKIFFDNAIKRHQLIKSDTDTWNLSPNWLNFLDVIKKEPVVIPGVFNFGLKMFAKAMKNNGYINSSWDTNCSNGMDAMITAFNAYKESRDKIVLNDIIKYNEMDCKLVYEIVIFFRSKNLLRN